MRNVKLPGLHPYPQLFTKHHSQEAKQGDDGRRRALYPDKSVKNADPELFRAGLYNRPLRLFGFGEMYLVPEDEVRLREAFILGVGHREVEAPVVGEHAVAGDKIKVPSGSFRKPMAC